jgi:hypothetical protein
LINKIDIKTEILLQDQSLTEERRNELNELREKQIEKIKEIKEINLQYLPLNINEKEYEEKWSFILNDTSLDYDQKIDQIKDKANLIHFDCVLLEEEKENNENGFDLWITSWFYNQKSLEFLK